MKARLTLTAIACALATAAAAQDNGKFTVTGQLTDSISGTPDSYSTIRLYPSGKKEAVAVAASGADGRFTLVCPAPGRYRLEAVALGRKPTTREVEVGKAERLDLGRILTFEASTTLGEATVTAAQPLVTSQIDRLSYSMADDPEAQSSTMLDMLRKVPLVTVDGQDNIQVNGTGSFKVYVNGKPNKMMSDNPSIVLKSFPANVVKKVEVITDPGAKYDAEGVAGILNIVTATEAETSGYTITPNLKVGTRGTGGSLFAMVQKGKLTLSANGGVQHQYSTKTSSDLEREVFADPLNHLLRTAETGRGKGLFGHGSLDASYEFSAKDLLTASFSMFRGTQRNHGAGQTEQLDAEGNRTFGYKRDQRVRNTFESTSVGVDYQHQFAKEEQQLTFSYLYNRDPRRTRSTNLYSELEDVPAYLDLEDTSIDPYGKQNEHTMQVDFTTPLRKHHTLSVGAKYILRDSRSDNTERVRPAGSAPGTDFVTDEEASLTYKHRNGIAAGYAEYIYKLEKFSLRSGLRFESSHIRVSYPGRTDHEPFSTTLNDWIPSLNLAYNLKPTMMLRAGYNMRIGRPGISYLSPYVDRSSPVSISYGTPDLTSERAHNVDLNFSSFKQKFSINVTARYSFSNNGLTAYSFLDEDGVLNSTYANSLHSKTFALSAYVNAMFTKTTTFTLNAEGNYRKFESRHTLVPLTNDGFGGGFFAMLRQDLPWKLKLGLGGGYHFREVNLMGKGSDFYFYFGSLSRSFLKDDRLTVSISAFNPFSPKRTFTETQTTADYRQTSGFTIHRLSNVTIGLSWRFGELKASVKKAQRSIDNDDSVKQSGGAGQGAGQGGGMSGAGSM